MRESITHYSLDAKDIAPFHAQMKRKKDFTADDIADLEKIGIFGMDAVMDAGYGMDATQADITSPSIGVPLQFAQQFLPGFVNVITAARKIDDIVGVSTVGSWEDEQIVQGVEEISSVAVPYTDLSNIPLAGWNTNWVTRNVIRYECGIRVGILEEKRAALMRVNAADSKRRGSAQALDIARNAVGFYGYNSGTNNTYGFLNDPNLLGYNTVATGAVSGSKLWSLKTWAEIVSDILTAIATLRQQSQDTINPEDVPMTLAIATVDREYMSKTNEFGISVMAWLNQTYPKIRVTSAPQLNAANGGANVFYLFADSINDGISTDDGRTFIQVVPAKFMVLGVQQMTKGYEEDYSNATAGVMCKRPYAVYRGTGI